jgi:hypothetical protein
MKHENEKPSNDNPKPPLIHSQLVNFSEPLCLEAISVFESKYGIKITRNEASQALSNLVGFFQVLMLIPPIHSDPDKRLTVEGGI